MLRALNTSTETTSTQPLQPELHDIATQGTKWTGHHGRYTSWSHCVWDTYATHACGQANYHTCTLCACSGGFRQDTLHPGYPKYNIHSPHCCRKALNHDWPLLPCRIDTQQVALEIQLANLWLDMCSMNIFMIARSVFEKREILINQWRFDPCDGTRASVDRPNKQYYPQIQHTFPVYIVRVLCSSSQK